MLRSPILASIVIMLKRRRVALAAAVVTGTIFLVFYALPLQYHNPGDLVADRDSRDRSIHPDVDRRHIIRFDNRDNIEDDGGEQNDEESTHNVVTISSSSRSSSNSIQDNPLHQSQDNQKEPSSQSADVYRTKNVVTPNLNHNTLGAAENKQINVYRNVSRGAAYRDANPNTFPGEDHSPDQREIIQTAGLQKAPHVNLNTQREPLTFFLDESLKLPHDRSSFRADNVESDKSHSISKLRPAFPTDVQNNPVRFGVSELRSTPSTFSSVIRKTEDQQIGLFSLQKTNQQTNLKTEHDAASRRTLQREGGPGSPVSSVIQTRTDPGLKEALGFNDGINVLGSSRTNTGLGMNIVNGEASVNRNGVPAWTIDGGRVSRADTGFNVNSSNADEGHADAGLGQSPSAVKAACVGAEQSLREVDDLLCMGKPEYADGMKNPCWWSDKPADRPSNAPLFATGFASTRTGKHLLCLPYFHILCCSKSATTDLYFRMRFHPDLVPNKGVLGKEPLYWSWAKYGLSNRDRGVVTTFSEYLYDFHPVANSLTMAFDNGLTKDLQSLITLDGSPTDMWDFRGWDRLPQNRHLRHPAVLTPHLMQHLYRDPKFIVIVREPIERLYTSYLFHEHGYTAQQFHSAVINGIHIMDRCLAAAQTRLECFVNITINDVLPLFLPYSCYAVYFAEWFKVFPRKHFLFIRTENYKADVNATLHKVFNFLDMRPPSSPELNSMLNASPAYRTKQRDFAGPMLEETKDLLRGWLSPYMEELVRLMGDASYSWQDEYDKWDSAKLDGSRQ